VPVDAADSSVTFQPQAPKESDLGKGLNSTVKSNDAPVDNKLEISVPTKDSTDVAPNELVRFLIPSLTADAALNSFLYYNDSGTNNSKLPLEAKITSYQGVTSAQVTIPHSIDKGKYVIAFERVITGVSEDDNDYKAEVYSAPVMVK
jgi:hypothetical protein